MEAFTDAGALFRSHPELRADSRIVDAVAPRHRLNDRAFAPRHSSPAARRRPSRLHSRRVSIAAEPGGTDPV